MSNSEWSEGFCQRLDVLRVRYGFSKAEMARKSGLPTRTFENYFKGHKPGVEALIAISRGLGIDIDWLIGEVTEDKSFNTDMVGEASWIAVKRYLDQIIAVEQTGTKVVQDGKLMGKETGQCAAVVEAMIVAEYVALRTEYAAPSLEDAKSLETRRRAI